MDAMTKRRAANFRRLRGELLQGDMARELGWCQSQLSEIETGRRPVTIKTIDRLAEVLGMEPWMVLQELDREE